MRSRPGLLKPHLHLAVTAITALRGSPVKLAGDLVEGRPLLPFSSRLCRDLICRAVRVHDTVSPVAHNRPLHRRADRTYTVPHYIQILPKCRTRGGGSGMTRQRRRGQVEEDGWLGSRMEWSAVNSSDFVHRTSQASACRSNEEQVSLFRQFVKRDPK